tara:strand:+ start:619 stop:1266 length:648 start_codon:yes stop_codon:yes gene_type:complete
MINKERNNTWQPFKLELMALIGSIMLALVLFVIFWGDYQAVVTEEQATNQQYEQLSNNLSDSIQGKALLKEVGASFKALKAQGFYGDEDRLALTEALKRAADKLKLPDFKYKISPQHQIENAGGYFPSELNLFETTVVIEAGLLHDADLISITNQLSSYAKEAFIVKSCKLSRERSVNVTELIKNVGLVCKLGFYNIKKSEVESGDEEIDLGDEI